MQAPGALRSGGLSVWMATVRLQGDPDDLAAAALHVQQHPMGMGAPEPAQLCHQPRNGVGGQGHLGRQVFVSGLSKRFNMQDANQSLIVDMDLGVAVDYVDSVRRIKNKTLRRAVLSAKMKEDNLTGTLPGTLPNRGFCSTARN